jgi:hypothetical protein
MGGRLHIETASPQSANPRKAAIRGGLVSTVHDELLAEVLQDDAAIASEIMRRQMHRAFEISFPGAPTNGLLKVISGQNWHEAKEGHPAADAETDENTSTPIITINNTQPKEASLCV